MKCGYCECVWNGMADPTVESKYVILDMDSCAYIENGELVVECSGPEFETLSHASINYCPMCGRDLRERS